MATRQTYEDPELTIEVDADGYRVDHRSETEQSSQAKEVHEYPDRTEIRLRDEKEVRLEEVKTRETTRRATYDDIIALLDAQLDDLDEIQTSREVTIQEFNRVETTRETVTDGELKREIRTTDEKRKEEILEGPSDSKRVVTTETETVVVQPSPGALSLHETESPLSEVSYNTASSSEQARSSLVIDPGLGTEPVRGGFNVGITPGEAEFRIRSEGLGGKTPEKTGREVVWVPKGTEEGSGNLRVQGDLEENAGSLHRIQHRAHRLEELIVEDVDTFYEDQTRPAKRHSGLLGVKKEKRGKSQSPLSTLEKRPKTEDIKAPTAERFKIEVESVTPKPSPERPAQPAGVSISTVPRTDIVIQPDVQYSGLSDKPRDLIVDPQDANTNRFTYVVTYDNPVGVNIRDSGKRKKDVHPKKKKDKRRLGKQQPETEHDMPAETEFVTYVVNYDRTEPLDGENKPPRPTVVTKPEGSFPEPSIPREPRATGNATIEVDMNAGEVKVMEPVRVLEERRGDSKTFVVNYELPAVEKSAKPGKPKKVSKEVRIPYSGNRQSPNDEITYIVNYDQPSVTPIVPPMTIQTSAASPDVDFDLEKKAPVYSITVVEPGPGVSVEKARKSPDRPGKKQDRDSKEAVELTYIVRYDEPQQGSVDDTDNLPRNEGGRDIWVRPQKPIFEAGVRGKEEIKAEPAELKGAPGTTESLTYVVEYERGAEEKTKGGIPVPKLKKGSSSDDVVEKMYTYIVNYDQPSSRSWKKEKKKKKEEKKGKDVKATFKADEPRLPKSYDIEQPSQELSFTVQHPFPEPITQPVKPTSELSIAVQHPIQELEIPEHSQEFSITVDHPFPEPVTQPEQQFEEYSITVDHPFPEPVTQPEEHIEDFSIAVDHRFPEPVTQPKQQFEEFSIRVDHPFPEPVTQPEEHFEEYSFAVDHPFPEPVTQREEQFEEYSFAVDHPFPEPEPEEQFEEFFTAVDYPFPEPVKQPEEHFEEFSIAVDHPIPKAHLEIKESVLPQPKLPEPIPSKDAGESLTYVVTYDKPTVSGEGKPTKTKNKRKPLFSKGSKPSVKAELATETSQGIPGTFTYIVNYDEPSSRLGKPELLKPLKTELSGKADVKAPKVEVETSAKISGPKETVRQTEELSITVTQPMPTISKATPVRAHIAPSEPAEGITYIVHHDEPFSVGLTGEKPKKLQRKEVELKVKKPAETEHEIDVLPEESAMPLPTSNSGLTIVVEHPEPKALGVAGDISGKASPTAETLTYVVNYDQPFTKTEKLKGAKGKRGFEGKKPRAAVEVDIPKVAVKTPEPPVVTAEVPKPRSADESVSFTVVHDQPELPGASAAIVTDGQWKPESSKEITFIVNYDLPSKTEQDVEVPQIEIEAPATIEISPSTENVTLELRDVQLPPTPKEPQTAISFNIEKPAIPAPALAIPTATGESVTYIVQYDEPRGKTTGKGKREKGKAKKKPSAGADIEVEEGAKLSTTTHEVYVTTDQPKPSVSTEMSKRTPEVSVGTTAPTVAKKINKDVATEQVTYIVNYDRSHKIQIPEVRDTTVVEYEAEDTPQIEPFEILEPEVEFEEPSSRLTITVEEPFPEVSAEVKPPTREIGLKVKEPIVPIVTTPEIALPKVAETITYVVTHEEPALKISGKVKPDKKEKKKKVSKDVKAGASVEAKGPEVTAEIAEGVPLYEVTVKTEQLEPAVDVKKKKPEVSVTTPEAVISITQPSADFDVQAQTQPQSITYVVTHDDSEVIPKSKDTTDIKGKKIAAPKLKPPKAPKGKISSVEGESITYVVTYDDEGKFVPPPKIKESEELKFEVQDIPEIKSPEIPQPAIDIEEPSSELTITVEQPLPEISAEVKPPTPEIQIQEPSEVEQLTITVGQPLPEVITEVKVKKPAKAVVTPPSVELPQADTLETFTYIVTHDEPTSKISGEAKPEKKEKKKPGLGFPKKEKSKQLKIEGELEAKEPKAAIKTSKPVTQVESLTYIVTYDDSGKVSPLEIEEPAEIEVQTKDIPHIKSPEIPEAEFKVEEPSSQLTIEVEHPLPDVSAEVEVPTPEIKVKGPSEFVVKPPSVEIPKVGAAETITYIVNHEDRALKTIGEVKPVKKEKKKRGFVFPEKKVSKDVKAGASVEAKGPEVTAEIAEGVPLYEVSVTTEQLEPSVDIKKKKKKKKKPQLSVTAPEAAISITKPSADTPAFEQAQAQSVTYIVTYDDTEKAVPPPAKKKPATVEVETKDIPKITIPKIPQAELDVEEPSSQLTITVEQPIPEISAKVKPPTPEVKIREPSEVEQLSITVEQPLPEISAEVKPPTPEIKVKEPSDVEQFTITVEQPLPEVSTEVKPPIPEVKVKKPSKVVVGAPSVELSKDGTAETITYIVTHEDRKPKISEVAEPETKEKKKKIHFPRKHFGKKYSVAGAEAKLKEPEVSVVTKGKEKPMPQAHIKAKKPAIDVSTGESVTYVVKYDDLSKVVPATAIKSPEIPGPELKVEEPSSELTIRVEQPLPEISAEVKPATPEIKIREPFEVEQFAITVEQPEISAEVKPPTPEIKVKEPPDIEQLTITVEQPLPEISAEVKPPTPEIKIREPSDVKQLTITVEQPLPEVSTKVKPPIPEVKVKKPSEVVVGPPSVELSKGGTAETFTYIVTHEDRPSKISEVAEPEKEVKKKKIRFPGKFFGKKYSVAGAEAKLKEPEVSVVTKGKEKPVIKAHIKAKKPAIDVSTGESVTYVVRYDDLSKVVPATEIKSPEIPEPELKVEEPSSELTIRVEQPLPEISAEVKPPTPEIKIREPSEVEQSTIAVEQPLPEISAEVKPPTPEIKVKEPSEVEQLTITIEQLPEISAEVKPPTPEIKVKTPSEVEQLTITVEQQLPEIIAEATLPTPEAKVKAPSEIVVKPPSVELPKADTTDTVTYIVTHEEPALKVSGEVKPEKKEKKQAGIRIPGKKVPKELKAGAGVAAKGPTTEVTGEVPGYEVTVTTEQPALPVEPEVAAAISGTKGETVLKDAVETVTYVVEHEKVPQAKEAISAEGEKKRKDWIWRVKKPSKSIDVSTESQDKESARAEPEAGISAKIVEPKVGISAEAETPGRDISISTEKARVTPEVSRLTGVPETHTYIVTYDEPQVTTSKGKLKLWPFSRKAQPGKLEVKQKPQKTKWTLFKKKEPKVVKPRVDVQLAELKPTDVVVDETLRGDIEVNVPAAPSIALEQKQTVGGDVSGTVEIPTAPEFSVTVLHDEPSITVHHPELTIPETGETDLEIRAEKPTDISQLKFDVEAKLPGRKEQVFAEKVVSGKVKVAEAETERAEPRDKDRSVISGGRRDEENAEEETVVYIVNYEQPFGTLTKTKDGAKEAPGLKPEVAVEAEKPDVTNVKHSVQVQMPQLEQCILVPIRDESSPEDSFYGTEAPVPAWPPADEPHFEEDTRPEVGRKFETSAVDEKQLPPHLVVVAVDFGTTFSGYAFSFSRDSAGSIHVMRKWEGGDPGAVDHKTPTILLLTPGGQFHSFGFTARDFYHDLSPKEAARWLYFEKFKMALHFNAELNTDTKLAAANGQCVPAIDVFTHALRFFRKHVLQEVSDQVSTEVLNEDIYWIITVPAIWSEEAKQFMRLAAYRAGIASPSYPDQLLISLEPEAASIYVRKQRLHQLVPEVPFQRRRSYRRSVTPEPTAVNQPIVASERKVLPTDSGQLVRTTTTVTVSWPVVTTIPQTDITVGHQVDTAGTRYMVVDCGGGTVDITVHEIQSRDGTLRELHRATGGPFGSVAVDQEFEKLLVEIFGIDFIDVFKAKRPAGWVDLLMAFESRKRAANPYITKPLNVSLPFSFIDYYKKYRNCPVEHAIRKYGNRDIRWSSQGMLRLMPDAMNRLFLPAIDKIKEAIGNVLNDTEVKGLRFLFLVGGFADSPMLQLAIRQEFGHLLRIIIPNDASISILKGAVCFGLDPTVITTRKSRMTYGVGVLNRFVHGQHPPSKLILKDGEEWCTDVFDALVYADQSVAIGDTVLRRYTLVPGDADDVTVSKVVNIYSSDRRDVKYVTERGVTRCGTLCLTDVESKKPSLARQDQKDREVQVRMTFGHTEIKVTACDLSTRKSVRATIDFLNK